MAIEPQRPSPFLVTGDRRCDNCGSMEARSYGLCGPCTGIRTRADRVAQGLPPYIENEAFYRHLAYILELARKERIERDKREKESMDD